MSIALIFPGQGSQAVGMGAELAKAYPAAQAVFSEVDEALGQKLSHLMWEGPEADLTLTENAQPALMAVSMAAMRVLSETKGVSLADKAAYVAGHSLGEYSALAAAGASVTVMGRLEPGGLGHPEWLSETFAGMRAKAKHEMAAEGYRPEQLSLAERLDLRYFGQSYELTVAVGAEDGQSEIASIHEIVQRFHRAHARRYGFERPEQAVQVVNMRLAASARVAPPALPELARGPADARRALVGRKQVWFGDGATVSRLYDRARLRAGNVLVGPAIVFQYDTTTVILPNWTAEVDQFGNLLLHNQS